jgi:hypothetical protein
MSPIKRITCPGGATQNSAPTESTQTKTVASARTADGGRLRDRVLAVGPLFASIILIAAMRSRISR